MCVAQLFLAETSASRPHCCLASARVPFISRWGVGVGVCYSQLQPIPTKPTTHFVNEKNHLYDPTKVPVGPEFRPRFGPGEKLGA